MYCGMPGFPGLYYLPKFAQIHVHWVSDVIQPSPSPVIPFSSCPQSFPVSGYFPMNQLFTSGGQNIGASASTSVFPMTIQGWFPLGLIGWISLLSKGLSRVFSSTIVQKHQFSGAEPSLWSNSHIRTWSLSAKCGSVVKNLPVQCRRCKGWGFNPWIRKIPWRKK